MVVHMSLRKYCLFFYMFMTQCFNFAESVIGFYQRGYITGITINKIYSAVMASHKSTSSSDTNADGSPPQKLKKTDETTEPSYTFPDTLEEFGYKFNEDGRMCNIETGDPFEFKVKEEHEYNQKRYEAIGETITTYVYSLLESRCGLKRTYIPIDRKNREPQSFIFQTDNAFSTKDKLMILIHGSGVVRAGQWARRLIMNDSLNSGTQIPYIEEAIKRGYEIVVLNTNLNYVINEEKKKVPIRGSEDPEKHLNYVWKNLLKKAPAKHIAIVAHSYGGVCTIELAKSRFDELKDRVFAIAFTDSVHSFTYQSPSKQAVDWLIKISRNWVGSPEPLDTPISHPRKADIPMVSAGHKAHEMTSWSSFTSVFRFFDERLEEHLDKHGTKSEL